MKGDVAALMPLATNIEPSTNIEPFLLASVHPGASQVLPEEMADFKTRSAAFVCYWRSGREYLS